MRRAAAALLVGVLALASGAPAAADAPAPARELDALPLPPSPAERVEQIRARVQAALVYPPSARERGIEGVTRIQFRVARDGRAAQIATVDTSGSRLLDAAAVQAARDARELPQLYGWVRIPVRFELERLRASAER